VLASLRILVFGLCAFVPALAPRTAAAGPLRIVATVPDLGELAREVGGDAVDVTVLTKGPQDPHFVEPRPSFIRALHDADLYLEVGMELEAGWAPTLLRAARNPKLLPGGAASLTASAAIRPLQVPTGRVDRSMGDIHVQGNPHFLVDPLNGLRVSAAIRDKLAALRPAEADALRERQRAFAARLLARLAGPELATARDPDELARALEDGAVPTEQLGGWLAAARPLAGTAVVEDHAAWIYFATRFGLDVVATLEPKPGIAPTTGHLANVVETVEQRGAKLILVSPHFDARHARWVAERTGARVVELAHQSGAREGAGDYLGTIDYNLRAALEQLAAGAGAP
jgi:ABC-type Zn uptake system ZnuABC Zn-binding protein ZnuA